MRKLVIFVILASVLSVASCAPAEAPVDSQPYPALIAHRGGLLQYPEGTMQAFKAAVEHGAMIEMDVWPLKDGTLVINHDETVDRTAAYGVTGKVSDMTLTQWRQLRITDPKGGPPTPAATLQDVLDEFGGTDTVLVPEIKDATRFDAFVEQLWPYRGQVIVQSLKREVVERLAKTGIPTLQVSGKPQTADIVPGVYAINMKETKTTPEVIQRWREHDVKIWAYMVNDQARANELIDMGVDAIMTDDPRLVIPS